MTGRIDLAAPVIDPERADMDQPSHAAQPHRLRHVAGAAEIDVEGERERLLNAAPDQARGVNNGVDLVLLDGLDQRRQIAHVLARERIAALAELEPQEIRPRFGIDENDRLAARQRMLRERGPDQSCACNQCRHYLPRGNYRHHRE